MNRLHTSPVQGQVSHPATFHRYKGATATKITPLHFTGIKVWQPPDATMSRIGTIHCETPLHLTTVQDIVRHHYISQWYKTLWDTATSHNGTRHCETPLHLTTVQDMVRCRYISQRYKTLCDTVTSHNGTRHCEMPLHANRTTWHTRYISWDTCQRCHDNMPLYVRFHHDMPLHLPGVWHTSRCIHQLQWWGNINYFSTTLRLWHGSPGSIDIQCMVLFCKIYSPVVTPGCTHTHAHQISPTIRHAKTASNTFGKWRTRYVTFCLPTTSNRITKMLQTWKLSDISPTITLSLHRTSTQPRGEPREQWVIGKRQ